MGERAGGWGERFITKFIRRGGGGAFALPLLTVWGFGEERENLNNMASGRE